MHIQYDKRHNARITHKTEVAVESLQSGIQENARMVNYSDEGLYFETDQVFQPGTEIFIGIENSPHTWPITYECYKAKIKWGKRLKNNRYAYGFGANYLNIASEQNSTFIESGAAKELRKNPRKVITKPARFRFKNESYQGFIKDISHSGCFIEHCEFFTIGQVFNLVIPGTKIDKDTMLKVEVVRLSPDGMGVKFKSLLKKKSKLKNSNS